MSMSEVRRRFQNQIREGIEQDFIDGTEILRVRQNLLMRRYAALKEENKGEKGSDGK